MNLLRRWAGVLVFLAMTPAYCAWTQNLGQPGSGVKIANLGGTLIASNFADWTVAQGSNGPLSWSSSAVCTGAQSGGVAFRPFNTGQPIRIVDTGSPALSETVTVTGVTISGNGCSLNVAPNNPHFGFYLTTATAGLQEAINYARCKPAVVSLTPDWTTIGGTTAMILAAQGCSGVSIADNRTAVPASYSWNAGTGLYVLVPAASGSSPLGQQLTLPGFTGAGTGSSTAIGPTHVTIDATGNYLTAKSVNGQRAATAYEATPGVTADGIAAALTDCGTAPCTVAAPAGYPATDATVPTGISQRLVNNTGGANVQTISNPGPATGSQGFLFDSKNCNQQTYPFNGNPLGVFVSACDNLNFMASPVGVNDGYSSAVSTAAGGWTVFAARSATMFFQSSGIHNMDTYTVDQAGVGDFNGFNIDPVNVAGNCSDPSCEGANFLRIRGGDTPFVFYATILQGGSHARQLYMNPVGGSLGQERYMYDYSAPYYAGFGTGFSVNGVDYGRITAMTDTNAVFPVSTFRGNLLHDITVQSQKSMPVTSPPTFSVCTYYPFSVASGTLSIGDLIAFDSTFHEQTRVSGTLCGAYDPNATYQPGQGVSYGGLAYTSSVARDSNYNFIYANNHANTPGTNAYWTLETVTTGQILVAAQGMRAHEAGSQVCANGMAGYGLDFWANRGDHGQDYPMEVVCSPDAHTLHLTRFFAGRSANMWQWGQVNPYGLPLTSVSVTGGVATITPQNGQNATYEQQPFVTLTFTSNSALNGRYENTQNVTNNTDYTATLCTTMTGTCVPSSYTGTGTGGYMQIGDTGNGNTRYTTRPMAEVLDVNDYSVPGKITSAGTSAYLEENAGSWIVGQGVEEASLYSLAVAAFDVSLGISNPTGTNIEYAREYIGGGGVATNNGNLIAFHYMTSGVPKSTIAGGGGIGSKAPRGMVCQTYNNGACGPAAEWLEPPFPSGSPMVAIDTPPDTTKYPFFYTPLLQAPAATGGPGGMSVNWTYKTGHLDIFAPYVYIPNLHQGADFTGTGDATIKYSSLGIHTQELNGQGCGQRASAYFSHGTGASYQQNWEWGTDSLCGNVADFYLYNYHTAHNALVIDSADNAHFFGNVYAGGSLNGTSLNVAHQPLRYVGTETTTASASDVLIVSGLVAGTNHCTAQQTGSATPLSFTLSVSTNAVNLYHAATAGAVIEVSCDLP